MASPSRCLSFDSGLALSVIAVSTPTPAPPFFSIDFVSPSLPGPGLTESDEFMGPGPVGGPDFGLFLSCFPTVFGPGYPAVCDLNEDGAVGGPDFGIFIAFFGGVPGPSGLGCAGTVPCTHFP